MSMSDGFEEGREIGEAGLFDGLRYRITDTRPLGVGAGSSVYAALDKQLSEPVAIKVIDRLEIDDDPKKLELLEREMNIWSKLKHPNIINLRDVVFEDDWVLLIVEYAGGGSLYSEIAAAPVHEGRARVLFQQMLAAVDYCNSNGIFHRDLKLENVVFSEGDILKITDFGT
jgi:serine/threonine protein kinase